MIELHHPALQLQLERDGCFVTPFLSDQKIATIRSLYNRQFKTTSAAFYSSSFHESLELKQQISHEIIAIIGDELHALFQNVKILGASFLVKPAGKNYPMPIHQDWTVTDENVFGSFSIWIPLQHTTKANGALRIIKGSHAIENNLRAPSLPVSFEKERARLERYLQTFPMQAGQGLVFNQKLMHASWPNESAEDRVALTVGVVPKAAELRMYYFDSKQKLLSKYQMPDDMFLRYPEIINEPRIGRLIEKTPYEPAVLTAVEIEQQLNSYAMKTKRPLFASAEQQHFFDENGYLIVPALNADEINELTEFLYSSGIKKETDYGFYVGMDHEDKALVGQMMDKVKSVALPRVEKVLAPYQLITASYVIKDPNNKGIVPPHQDWTFVEDESLHSSVTCWIPLQDTTMQNGCIGVIKGSNSYFNSVRPSPSPQVPSPLAKHLFGIFPYLHLLEMKAGDALFFDNRTIHASPPNVTTVPRLAVGLSFTQAEAELRHFYLKPGTKDRLLKYKVDPSFYRKYDNSLLSKLYDAGKCPEGYELMEEVPFLWDDWNKSTFEKRMKDSGNTYNSELTQQMTRLFGAQMKDGIVEKVKKLFSFLKA